MMKTRIRIFTKFSYSTYEIDYNAIYIYYFSEIEHQLGIIIIFPLINYAMLSKHRAILQHLSAKRVSYLFHKSIPRAR